MKKLLALIVALSMVLSIGCITSFAEDETTEDIEILYTDDFESYVQDAKAVEKTVDGKTTYPLPAGGARYVTKVANPDYVEGETTVSPTLDSTNWYASSAAFGFDGNARAGIVQNPTKLGDTDAKDNVLALESRSTATSNNMKPRIINMTNISAYTTDKCIYSFDFYKGSMDTGGGIMFNWTGGKSGAPASTKYYAIDFVSMSKETGSTKCYIVDNNGTTEYYSTVFIKNNAMRDDATIITDPDTTTFVSAQFNDYIANGKWYTAEVTVHNGKISWTVTRKDTGAVVQTGMWVDPDPIAVQPTNFGFFAGCNGSRYMYFDNVSVKKVNVPYVEPDPDVPENAIIFDTFNSYKAVSGTENYINANNKVIAGDWVSKQTGTNGFAGNAKYAIIEAGHGNNCLTVEGQASYGNSSMVPYATYIGASIEQDDIYNYQVDIYRDTTEINGGGGGLRFNQLGENSYYELYFQGENCYTDGTKATHLAKFANGTYTRLDANIQSTGLTNNMIKPDKWYTLNLTVEKGEISWTLTDKNTGSVVQTGSYVDTNPFRGTNFKLSLFAKGNRYSYMRFDNVVVTRTPSTKTSLNDIHVTIEDGVYTYKETFEGYDEDDGAVGVADGDLFETSAFATRAGKADLAVIRNDAGSWNLSMVHSWQGFPGAYINSDRAMLITLGHQGKNTVFSNTRNRYYPAVVNFAPKTTGSIDLQSLQISIDNNGASRNGIRIAVSEDENSYYEFGRGDVWDYTDDVNPDNRTGGATGIPKYAPYVLKCVNGERTMLDYAKTTAFANGENTRTWTITVDGSDIIVTGKTLYVNDTYTYTIKDTDGLLEKMAYPLAVYSAASSRFDNVTMKYVPDADVFVDNGDGTATITAVPARYIKSSTSLKIVTSFFDENDNFISTNEKSLSAKGSYKIATPANYDYAKVMLYDGAALVKVISTKEETVTVAKDKKVVACIGDSNTGNGGVTTNDSWSRRIQALLGEDYDVQNYGRAGYRLMNGYESGNPSYTLSEEYAASLLSNPDIVIIMLGTNDGDIGTGSTRTQFKEDYLSLIAKYQSLPKNPEIILAVPPIRGSAAKPNTNADSIRPVIQEICEELDLRYVDMTLLVTDYSMLYDGLHFTDDGYFAFADHFYNAVKRNVTTTVYAEAGLAFLSSDSSFDSDIMVAVYKDDKLTGVHIEKDAHVISAEDYMIDLEDVDVTAGDKVKVMILNDEVSLSPFTYAQTVTIKDAYTSKGKSVIAGNVKAHERVGVTVYSGANLVYADSKNADDSGYYQFTANLPKGTYTVNVRGNTTTLVVE